MQTPGPEHEAQPVPVPPPPMARQEASAPPEVRLPWFTPLAMAVAGGIGGVIWKYWLNAAPGTAAVRYFVLSAGVTGLGATVLDHLARRWPRALRWTIGMATGAAVPIAAEFLGGPPLWWLMGHPASLRAVPASCGCALAVFAALGLAFGLCARPRGLATWLLSIGAAVAVVAGGIAAFATPFGLYIGTGGVFATRLASVVPIPVLGPDRIVVADAALGLLLGLALAVCLWAAQRRQQPPNEVEQP